ncbi:methyl-accepting chemotaxis protein [Xylophilus sp. GOD-11R]|uniref:methyl-accepting chemotaxis protein n=1 Tax=Xylophilus sp. GOD-11R TaxID=3089814 RepID=UPI00298D20B3|nr:methyl-accepting chemotaxis protein [Xylophilus sp. GOD-11R]WPB57140.1 methyl-accepting chemotaxis protein [Xylophilus sp. GOD-11R]
MTSLTAAVQETLAPRATRPVDGALAAQDEHQSLRQADRVMLFAIGVSLMGALVLAMRHPAMGTAVGLAALLSAMAGAAYLLFGGTLASRLTIALVQVALVALHIQLAYGAIELHFGVFVTLALLMVYRDWRVVVFAAALFALHHALFDRLQAAGYGFYCTTQADFDRVLLHAVYVVVQTGIEVVLVRRMQRMVRAGQELTRLVSAINSPAGIDLQIDTIAVHMPKPRALAQTVGRIRHAVEEVRQVAGDMEHTATSVADGGERLRQRTARVTESLEETAASLEEIASTSRLSREAAHSANAVAAQATDEARRGGAVMQQMVSTMQVISEGSARIGDIVGMIDSIAFQTNILALNAAVEAARAGEQGRGFAVVAGEVRSLSQRSAQAAREIKALIEASTTQVRSGAQLVAGVGDAMGRIVASVEQVASLMEQVDTATSEQQRGIEHVNESVAQIEAMTQETAHLAHASADASQEMRDEIDRLARAMAAFVR